MKREIFALIILILFLLLFDFAFVCLVTWAICFLAGLAGLTIAFSWKLVLAIWIIVSLLTSIKTVSIRKG